MLEILFHVLYNRSPLNKIPVILVNGFSFSANALPCFTHDKVPASTPLRNGDIKVYVVDINQLSFYSVLASVSVFMALSTVFCSINSPDNSVFSLCSSVSSLPYWSFQLASLYENLLQP